MIDITRTSSASQGSLSEWQVDNLLRSRAIDNTKEASDTLGSIVKLIHQIENMPVKKDVRGDVIDALDALDEVIQTSTQISHAKL